MKLSRTLLLTTLLTGSLSCVTLKPAHASDVTFNFKMQASGTATFDADNSAGNDANDTNNIIRTQDIITYQWQYAVNNGAANNVVLHATVPANAAATLPVVCKTGSLITVNPTTGEQVIDCILGAVPSGATGSIDLKVRVLGQERITNKYVANLDTTIATGFITADNITNTVNPVTVQPLTISAKPKADLIKDAVSNYGIVPDPTGVPGYLLGYPITIAVTGSGKGSEALVGDINFTDTLITRVGASSDGPAISGAKLYTWRPSYTSITPGSTSACNRMGGDIWTVSSSYPNGKIGSNATSPTYATADRSTGDSGNWTCTQSAPGQPIQIQITGADTSGNNAPTLAATGNALPANKTYLAVGAVYLWVPTAEVIAAGGQLNVRNKLSAFTVNGASGAPNVEPLLTNNQYDHSLLYGVSGNFSSYYSKNIVSYAVPVPGQSVNLGGDGSVVPNQVFAERIFITNNGQIPWDPGAILCTAIDNETQSLTPVTPGASSGVKNYSTAGVLGVDYVIEYGTGGFATPTDHKQATCRDTDSTNPWTTDLQTVVGGPSAVTRVRIRSLTTIALTKAFDMALNLTARNTYLTSGAQIPLGTQLVEYSSFYIPGYPTANQPANMPAGWRGGYYNPVTHAQAGWGDRLVLTRAQVRVDKQNVPNNPVVNAIAGDEVSFVLKPTITAPVPTIVQSNVILKDTLPINLDYVVGSANIPPTSIVDNPDGSQLLIWDLGPRVPGQVLSDITYKAKVRLDAANNSTSTNIAVIESPDDATPVATRTDKVDVNIGNAAAFQIFKEVDKVLINPNDPIKYTLFYSNTGGSDVGASQFIDILPHVGDGRLPATTFVGAFNFDSIVGTKGETFEYTNRPYNQINPDPIDASNQPTGSTKWCTSAQFGVVVGCPTTNAEVTGIRINAPLFLKNTPTRTLRLTMLTNGNSEDNYYTNNFSGRAAGLLGFLRSNDVFSKVKVPSRLLLVKRITAINGVPVNTVVDDPNTNADNHPVWPAGYLKGAIDGGVVKPNDDVEYTIYYLSSGDYPVTNSKFCDRVPTETSYFAKGYNAKTPVAAGATPGSDLGIRFDKAGLTEYISGDADGDKGTFFPVGVNPNISCSGTNSNGAVTVNMGTIIQSGYGGSPSQAYGLVRFKSKVK